jgi:hypothetical protein
MGTGDYKTPLGRSQNAASEAITPPAASDSFTLFNPRRKQT